MQTAKSFRLFIAITCLLITGTVSKSQSVGIGTPNPDVSAMLDITSANKGLLVPRVALTDALDIVTIPSPTTSLLIYNTATSGSGRFAVSPGFYYFNALSFSWTALTVSDNSAKGAWLLGGNLGTTPISNFIGTADNQALLFKINNQNAGYLGLTGNAYWGLNSGNINSIGSNNTAIGSGSLVSNTMGYSNVAIGNNAMRLNTVRSNTVAVGDSALFNNGTNNPNGLQSIHNTAVGSKALYANTTGTENTGIGFNALSNNVTGVFNTALGSQSLDSNTTGGYNIAAGTWAMRKNKSGSYNTAFGESSMFYNDGHYNTALGAATMYYNTTGNSNVAVGNFALLDNTTGYSNVAIGSLALPNNMTSSNLVAIGDSAMYSLNGIFAVHNTAVGSKSLYSLISGNGNTAIGYQSLYKNMSVSNTAIGDQAMYYNTTGNVNVAIGSAALISNINGNGNVAVGSNSLGNNLAGSNNTSSGHFALSSNTSGSENTGIGYSALSTNMDGYGNVAIGKSSLNTNISGFNNTGIGYNADVASTSLNNATAIGNNAQVACNDCMVLGSIGGVNGALFDVKVGIGTTSPQTKLHVSPNGAGSILVGTNRSAGGYTNLEMGISSQSGGYSYIQSTTTSGIAYGNLLLNQFGGNVGIRVTTPLSPLHIKQSSDAYPVNGGGLRLERLTGSNHWEMGTDNGDDLDFVYNGVSKGYISNSTGAFTVVSDMRMKKDIQSIGSVIPGLMQLQPKTYHYIDNKIDAPLSYGFIAQEVEKIYPDFVTTKGADNMKAITYQNFSVVAIKAIQEQQKEIEELKEKNKIMMDEFVKMQLIVKDLVKAKGN